jgi:hypothetical protein
MKIHSNARNGDHRPFQNNSRIWKSVMCGRKSKAKTCQVAEDVSNTGGFSK